jgi:hypothetical protein
MSELTGATRYRTGWFGRLILQVEERYVAYYEGRPGFERRPDPNPIRNPVHATKWRDASVSDFPMLEYLGAKARGENPPPPDWPVRVRQIVGGYQPAHGSGAPLNPPSGGSAGQRNARHAS